MEPYNIWIFLVIAMATSQHLSAQKKEASASGANTCARCSWTEDQEDQKEQARPNCRSAGIEPKIPVAQHSPHSWREQLDEELYRGEARIDERTA
ncbi:hypothetical protein MRX96_042591 [Rhipicephalus microplus]